MYLHSIGVWHLYHKNPGNTDKIVTLQPYNPSEAAKCYYTAPNYVTNNHFPSVVPSAIYHRQSTWQMRFSCQTSWCVNYFLWSSVWKLHRFFEFSRFFFKSFSNFWTLDMPKKERSQIKHFCVFALGIFLIMCSNFEQWNHHYDHYVSHINVGSLLVVNPM